MYNSDNKLKAARSKAAFKQQTFSGSNTSGATPSGSSRIELFGTQNTSSQPKQPSVYDPQDLADLEDLQELSDFIDGAIDDAISYKRSEPSVADTRKIIDGWISEFTRLKPTNVAQTQALNTAIRSLQALYKNKSDTMLRLAMFGNTHWWDNVANILKALSKLLKRSFIRPRTIQQPKPGHLNAPLGQGNEHYNEEPDETGKLRPVYSKEEIVIIGDIRDLAMKTILVNKNVQAKINNLNGLLPFYKSAVSSLIAEETKLVKMVSSHFKSVKINFGGLFNKIRDKVDPNPDDDTLIKRATQDLHKAELDAQFPQKIKPTMVVYGSKITDYNSKKRNQGFRDRDREEDDEVYALRQKVFATYGDAYYAHLLKITQEPKNELGLMNRNTTPFVTVPPEMVAEALQDATTQKTKLDKVLSSRVYIEPDYVVYGTRVSSLKFRKFDPKIDYNQTIYNGRAQVWQVWSDAYRKQYVEIVEYDKLLKQAETTSPDALPDAYDGVPISFKQFRDFDKNKDSNKQVYLIKVRIWNTYHNLSISYESDVVNKDFQNLYQKTVEFVDSLIDSIENITNDEKADGVFGGQTPARMAMQKLVKDIDLFNTDFTTAPWNKTFILLEMGGEVDKGNQFVSQLSHLVTDFADLAKGLTSVSNAMSQENVALKVLTRSIDKYNPDGTNAFLEYYKNSSVKLPETNSPDLIAGYLYNFLMASKTSDDDYGVANILDLI